jgi:hypothetical protein
MIGAVADGAIFLDDRRRLAGVDHAIILHAGARADDDGVGVLIGSQHRAPPDARFVADGNVADNHRRGRDECGRCDVRFLAFVLNDHRDVDLQEMLGHDMRRGNGNQDCAFVMRWIDSVAKAVNGLKFHKPRLVFSYETYLNVF